MALDLKLEVTADTRQAERSFKSLDEGIAQVEKSLKELETQQKATEQAQQRAAQSTSKFADAVKGYVTAGVVIGAVKATMDWAGALTDLSAKTGISTTMLQKLQTAAGDSGVTVEKIGNAVQQMANRLASGDKSAVGAVQALGLSLTTLMRGTPDQAFLAIATAVGKIEDPMKRAQVAADLFGRSGLDLTKILNGEFVKAVDSATAASEESISALDDMGDAMGRLWQSGKVLLATVLQPLAPVLEGIAKAAGYAAKGIGDLYAKIPSGFGALGAYGGTLKAYDVLFGGPGAAPTAPAGPGLMTAAGYSAAGMSEADVTTAIKDLRDQARETTARQKRLAKASDEAAQALEQQAAIALRFNNIVRTSDWLMARSGAANMGLTLPPLQAAAGDLTNTWGGVANTGLLGWNGNTGISPASFLSRAQFNWSGAGLGGLNAAMPFLAQALGGSATGGSIGGALGGVLGSQSMFGGLSGLGGFAGILGGIAPFLGPALGIVGSLIGKLFGPSEGKLASQDRSAYIQSLGGNEAFNQQFRNAQISPDEAARLTNQLMSANSREAVKAAQEAINAAIARNNALLQEQAGIESEIAAIEEQRKALADSLVTTYDQVVQITRQYGINLDAAGQKVQQLGSTETFTDLLNNMQALERAGFDVGTMLDGMADEISNAVNRAIQFGTTVPENMRKYIESLAAAGRLVDANGQAITDLSQIQWGPAVQTQADIVNQAMAALDATMQSLVSRLEEIVDLLANRIPGAANSAAGAINGIPSGEEPEVQLAAGGIVTRPTVALIGESGPEAVIPLGRGGLGRGVVVNINVNGYLDSQQARSHLASVVASELGRELRVRRRA